MKTPKTPNNMAHQLRTGAAVLLLIAGTSANAQWICEDAPTGSDSETLSDGRIVMLADLLDESGQNQGGEVLLRDPNGIWQTIGLIDNASEGLSYASWDELEVGLNDEIYVGGSVTPEGKGNPPRAVVIRKGLRNGATWDWETVDFYTGESRKAESVNIQDLKISNAGQIAWLGKNYAGDAHVVLRSSFTGDSGMWETTGNFQEFVADASFDYDAAGNLYIVTAQVTSIEVPVSSAGKKGKGKNETITITVIRLWTQDTLGDWFPNTIYGPNVSGFWSTVDLLIADDGRMIVAGNERPGAYIFGEKDFVIISSNDGGITWTEDIRFFNENISYLSSDIYQDSNGLFYFPGKTLIDGIVTTTLIISDPPFPNWWQPVYLPYEPISSLTSNSVGLLAIFNNSEGNCSAAFMPW